MRQADAFWAAHFAANATVLGVHLRGTDKPWALGVGVFMPMISAFLCHHPAAAIFVATDDR